jgi:HK97 family phage major capsid protein
MTLQQLLEKRNTLMANMTTIVEGDFTPEKRTQFDTLTADVAVVDGDIARVKAAEEHRAAMKNPVNQPRPNPSESNDPEERAEVRAARDKENLRHYMRSGERRDLTVAGQGVAIPVGFDSTVIEARKSYGDIYNIVNVVKTDTGSPIKMVLDSDVTNSLTSVTVGTNAGEVDPTLSGVSLQVDTYTTGVIKVDNGFLTDAGFDVEAWIRDRFGLRFFRGASNLIINGDGGNVASLTAAYNAYFVESATASVISYPDFPALLAELDPAYYQNACWAMNQPTLSKVVGLTDDNHRPLFLPGLGNASQGFVGTILGWPVKLVTQLPNVGDSAFPILFGDFKEGYTFRQQNPGIGILRLNELFAAGYETGFVGFARVGGVVTDAGTHPIVSLKITPAA